MAHIYLTFDFAGNEEKAQQARHKLDSWKQAFRLDKKLLYKFDRGDGAAVAEEPEGPQEPEKTPKKAKAAKGAKSKARRTDKEADKAVPSSQAKLYLRLAFSNHEKLTEQRWVDRIPVEEPFKDASPAAIREGEAGFEDVESHFEELN